MLKTRQMRLFHYGLAVAAAFALLPGCSNEELQTGPEAPVYVPGDSEVEIRFGADTQNGVEVSVGKRALVEDDDRLDMGVFCLARGKQPGTKAEDIAWFQEPDNYGWCLMKNVQSVKETDGNVTWDGHYFYPLSNWYMYEFYGYSPYQEDASFTYEATADAGEGTPRHRATAHFTLDGKTDIVWGRATLENYSAYSAASFRDYPEQSGTDEEMPLPNIGLQHVLTGLQFAVKPGVDPANSEQAFADAGRIQIDKIEVVDAVSNVDLIVADMENRQLSENGSEKETSIGSGFLSASDRISANAEDPGRTTFVLPDDDDTEFTPAAIGTELTPHRVGGTLMLCPEPQFKVRITLRKKADAGGEDIVKVSELIPIGPPYGQGEEPTNIFRSGYIYTVNITVNDIEEIKAQANISEWQFSNQNIPVVL